MKRTILISSLLILFITAKTLFVFSQETEIAKDSLLKIAHAGLERYLKIIKNSNVRNYGFNSIDDLDKIELGMPAQIFRFSRSFYEDTVLIDDDYIMSTNEYRIPLIVNDTICSFLTIAYFKSQWEVVAFGENLLADNIMQCIQKYKLDKSKEFILLREPSTYSDYLISDYFDKNKETAYFPAMSNIYITKNKIPDKKMTKKEILHLIHQKYNSSNQMKKYNHEKDN